MASLLTIEYGKAFLFFFERHQLIKIIVLKIIG